MDHGASSDGADGAPGTPVKRPRDEPTAPMAPRKKVPSKEDDAVDEDAAEADDDYEDGRPCAEDDAEDDEEAAGPVDVFSVRVGMTLYGRIFSSFEDAYEFVQKLNVSKLLTLDEIYEKYGDRMRPVADGDQATVFDIGSHANFNKISILVHV